MIIYCAGPIKGDTTYQESYIEIIKFLEHLGHSALTELNGKFNSSIPLTDKQIYTRDIKWIDGSQLMIAEISGPSLGVGFEIAYALFQKKIPVLTLAQADVKKVSAMISGCESKLIVTQRYRDIDDMKRIVEKFLKDIKSNSDHDRIHLSVFKKAH